MSTAGACHLPALTTSMRHERCLHTPIQVVFCPIGLHFFPALISPEGREFHDRLALSWQAQGRAQMLSQQQRRQPALPPGHQAEDLRRLGDMHPTTGRSTQQTAAADAVTAAKELPIGLLDKSPTAQARPCSTRRPQCQRLTPDKPQRAFAFAALALDTGRMKEKGHLGVILDAGFKQPAIKSRGCSSAVRNSQSWSQSS